MLMLRAISYLLVAVVLSAAVPGCTVAKPRPLDERPEVNRFIKEMVQKHRFTRQELEEIFSKARIRPSIIAAISRPAESKPWYEYRPIFVTSSRISGGVAFWKKNADILERAQATYGVPPQILVAILGVETRYGQQKGGYPVIDSLSTLAFDYPPRSAFFKKELEQYLLMTREENIDPLKLVGSYAGAMGQPQFISSSFRSYAVDFDGDGHRDLWDNAADAIGSVANYFKKHGWQAGEPIASRADVKGKDYQKLVDAGLKPSFTPAQLRQAGVTFKGDPGPDAKGALIELKTDYGHEYWVGWQNFYVITRYNHSALYAMAVYQLSERIRQARED
ncbi:MAG TPA: lytic murein transglycosylase B [Gammaproteobacteria bacterium]|nr:lytic murein transglycosylase B [Gammaproteobacteria bacterium]